MSLVLLAGYMNTYTSNPAPIDPTGGFAGNTVTPFDYGTCPCHAAVQRSRDLVSVQRAATLAQSDQTAVAVNRSSNIVWTGKARSIPIAAQSHRTVFGQSRARHGDHPPIGLGVVMSEHDYWQVESSVYGGVGYAPATLEEYAAIAKALDDEAAGFAAIATAWESAALQLQSHRHSAPMCVTLQSGDPSAVVPGHVTAPYAALGNRCYDHATACQRLSDDLRGAPIC